MTSFIELPAWPQDPNYLLESDAIDGAIDEMCAVGGRFNLRMASIDPREISDFADIAGKLDLQCLHVIRVEDDRDVPVFFYRSEDYEFLGSVSLVAINDAAVPQGLSLQDLFLHAVAHFFTGAREHDLRFLVCLNLLRAECGFAESGNVYDCGTTYRSSEEAKEALHRAAETAKRLRSNCSLETSLARLASIRELRGN
jgi:hypothetical protein